MEETRDYVFDCPVHGLECKVLCFRAFDENNRPLWRKVVVTYREEPFIGNELELLLESLTRSPQHMVMVRE